MMMLRRCAQMERLLRLPQVREVSHDVDHSIEKMHIHNNFISRLNIISAAAESQREQRIYELLFEVQVGC